ncbi:peptidase M48 [Corallococcus sicarius]|uniref:Peptidase M48 n=2 Tax=Corallococcus sicarius TaxID=2316726 RepID=A0A3A8NP86_9BACT|nr:peptidase M48 [Corallococcus sicarius]
MMRSLIKVLASVGVGLCLTSCVQMTKGLKAAKLGGLAGDAVAVSEKFQQCDKLETPPAITEEYALGSALAIRWVQQGGGLMLSGASEQQLNTYVNTVGRNLAMQSPRPTLRWTFGVLEDARNFNAVSAPGGYVFVTRKLLQGVENEGQLAGVLAHEIAHIALKHALSQYATVKVRECRGDAVVSTATARLRSASNSNGLLDLDADTDLLGTLADSTIEELRKGNSKDQELAADRLAVELMLSAGYDPGAYQQLLDKMPEGDGGAVNHPEKQERMEEITAFLRELKDSGDSFVALSPGSLHNPALPASFSVVKATGVAKDTK